MGVAKGSFLLKTAKVSDDSSERTKGEQSAREGAPVPTAVKILLFQGFAFLKTVNATSKERKTAKSAADLQVVDGIMKRCSCERRFQ